MPNPLRIEKWGINDPCPQEGHSLVGHTCLRSAKSCVGSLGIV